MSVYNQPAYRGQVLNLPPDKPAMFYAMVEYHGLQGRNVVGQLYDPFYYLPNFSYAAHPATGDALLQCWRVTTRTRWWALDTKKSQYQAVIAHHPGRFTQVGMGARCGGRQVDVAVPPISAPA